MNRLRKDYIDPHTPGNVSRLNSDLNEIHNYMCQNLNDVLARGDKLEHVQNRRYASLFVRVYAWKICVFACVDAMQRLASVRLCSMASALCIRIDVFLCS